MFHQPQISCGSLIGRAAEQNELRRVTTAIGEVRMDTSAAQETIAVFPRRPSLLLPRRGRDQGKNIPTKEPRTRARKMQCRPGSSSLSGR